jgi:serine/threonine protein kinase
MKITAVDVGQRFRCPTCAAQEFERETFDIDENALKGENPLVYLARRKVADENTVALQEASIALTPTAEPRPPSERHTARSPSPTPPPPPPPSIASAATGTISPPPSSAPSDSSSQLVLGILPTGSRLGTYRIMETLGHGGMGVVYKAQDERLDRPVALKVLSRQLTASKAFIERFQREARAAAALSHPNITVIYFIGDEDRTHYYAMEFVLGKNLAELVKEQGPFPVARALDVLRQCAHGLRAAAQSGIIHRDVKPSNVLLTPDGRVKITDFGLAKAVVGAALELTSTGVVMGTPTYMSPEQGRGGTVDHRSDIYSLGATLYHLIIGSAPFDADSPIALILKHLNEPVMFPREAKVGDEVKGLVARMLEKEPERRFPTYDALLEAIDRVARGEGLPRAESEKPRVIVLRHRRDRSTAKRSLFKVGRLSVARTNLKLGRRDKAVALLRETLAEAGDPDLKSEAALLLLEIFEKDGDQEQAAQMAATVAEVCKDGAAVAYAAWKLAMLDERGAIEKEKSALARYERILREPPEGMPRALVEAQVKRLRARIESSERELGTTQIVLGDEEATT